MVTATKQFINMQYPSEIKARPSPNFIFLRFVSLSRPSFIAQSYFSKEISQIDASEFGYLSTIYFRDLAAFRFANYIVNEL